MMTTMHRERWFALIMGVDHVESFVEQYNAIMEQLIHLEAEYRVTDPSFQLADMWTCQSIRGQVRFSTTRRCQDINLRIRLMDIFDSEMAES